MTRGARIDISRLDPVTRAVIEAARASDLTYVEITGRAGVTRHSLIHWSRGHSPTLATLAPVAEVLGFRLVLQPLSVSAERNSGQTGHDGAQ